MKKCGIIVLCFCAVLLLSACGKAQSVSGGQSSSVPGGAASEPSSALPAPETASASAASGAEPAEPEPAESGPAEPGQDENAPEPVVMNAAPSFISLPVTEADGAEGEKALIVLHVPESWAFDQYITFSRGEMKIAEFPRLWRAADGASPFSTEMLAPYQGGAAPEEDAAAEDLELDGNRLRVLHLQTWMNGSEEIWYMHCAFYAVDGYVAEAHLYTVQEWGGADSEELLAALRTLEVHSGGETS